MEQWKDYVREQVNSNLDKFLELAIDGSMNVEYGLFEVTQQLESGPEYNKNKAKGVAITLVFNFEDYIDIGD